MDLSAIVAKTRKGAEEIQNRSHGLDRNLRYVLILIDGKTSVQQMVEGKGALLPDVRGSLRTLAEQGYISIGGVTVDSPNDGDVDGVVVVDQDIASAKSALIAVAKEVLGANANKVISKLEDAPNSKEGLQEAVNGCKKLVRLLIDEKKGDELMTRCSKILQGL